jgi:hypothetical protein
MLYAIMMSGIMLNVARLIVGVPLTIISPPRWNLVGWTPLYTYGLYYKTFYGHNLRTFVIS